MKYFYFGPTIISEGVVIPRYLTKKNLSRQLEMITGCNFVINTYHIVRTIIAPPY